MRNSKCAHAVTVSGAGLAQVIEQLRVGFLATRARGGSIAAGAVAAGSERRRQRNQDADRAEFLSRFSIGERHRGFGRDWLGLRIGPTLSNPPSGSSPWVFEIRRSTTAAPTGRAQGAAAAEPRVSQSTVRYWSR